MTMTLPRTGIIRYNLADRGRKARGVDRNFDTVTAARLINSPSVQEKIRLGDMLGYFGHWPREMFGLNPKEGGVVKGQAVSVEPALRTVSAKATPDGWVEHEVEFLATSNGKIAARLFASKTGGFSSAIRAPEIGGRAVPTEFHGFDFVLEPNYSTNRGYEVALDGVEDVYDAVAERQQVMEICAAEFDQMQDRLDAMQAEMTLMSEALAKVSDENTYYLSRLAAESKGAVVLDGIMDLTVNSVSSVLDNADAFLTAPLVQFQKQKAPPAPVTESHRRQLSRYGV